MTAASLAPIQPLDAPTLNNIAGTTLIEPRNIEREWRLRATAGTSDSIADIVDAWDQYAVETGALDRYLDLFYRSPSQVNTAEYRGASLMTGFFFTATPPVEDWSIAVGAIAAGMLIPACGSMPFWTYSMPFLQPVNVDPLTSYRSARADAEQARQEALSDIRRRLDRAKAVYLQRSPREVAVTLADQLGVGQLVVARALGVTPTAVRKWRRGEPARPEHRDRLAQLAALFQLLSEVGVHDPAGWFDIAISAESTLTPLDLFGAGRADIVVLYGAGIVDPHETLDTFRPSWRLEFTPDRDYEVVRLADGSRSVVPRQEESR